MRVSLVLLGIGYLLFSCSDGDSRGGNDDRSVGTGGAVIGTSGGTRSVPSGGRSPSNAGHGGSTTGGKPPSAGSAIGGRVDSAGGRTFSAGENRAGNTLAKAAGDDGSGNTLTGGASTTAIVEIGGAGGAGTTPGGSNAGRSGPFDDGGDAGAGGLGGPCRICAPGEPCRTPRCGDGFVDGWCEGECVVDIIQWGNGSISWLERNYQQEYCDDGNDEAGDGCFECQIEAGFVCRVGTSCYRPSCGDGKRDTGGGEGGANGFEEECDDGNVTPGDGCSPRCQTEYGPCGDGKTEGGEACDDGNTTPLDGCSEICTVEPGWDCSFATCYQLGCGNGHFDGSAEECDDGNMNSGDGCDSACHVEAGFVCESRVGPCHPLRCGDGFVNFQAPAMISHDVVQSGAGEGGVPGAGDGGAGGVGGSESSSGPLPPEQCDDGNNQSGDGCDARCQTEYGWDCHTGDCVRRPKCSLVDFSPPHCDDGNEVSGDGCSADCILEPGYVCSWPQGCRLLRCGDGIVDPPETCDDANSIAHDGCTNCRADGLLCGH
jgi:cysteine-rich repeat protein